MPKVTQMNLKPAQAAKVLGISVRKVYYLHSKRILPYTTAGGPLRFPVEELIEWRNSQIIRSRQDELRMLDGRRNG